MRRVSYAKTNVKNTTENGDTDHKYLKCNPAADTGAEAAGSAAG